MSSTQPTTTTADVNRLAEQVADLTERVEQLEQEKERAEQERDELREENEELRADLREERTRNGRIRGMVANLINTVREYDPDEGEGVAPEDPDMPREMATVAEELHDTVEHCRENRELLKVRERDHDQSHGRTETKVQKQLSVLRFAQKFAKTEEKSICRMDYKDVAREYGCHPNDAYRVMRDMADEVPGVLFKNGRTLDRDHRGVGGKHVEVQLHHPEIHAWIRARE